MVFIKYFKSFLIMNIILALTISMVNTAGVYTPPIVCGKTSPLVALDCTSDKSIPGTCCYVEIQQTGAKYCAFIADKTINTQAVNNFQNITGLNSSVICSGNFLSVPAMLLSIILLISYIF